MTDDLSRAPHQPEFEFDEPHAEPDRRPYTHADLDLNRGACPGCGDYIVASPADCPKCSPPELAPPEFDPYRDYPFQDGVTYFNSGSNHAGEIRGLALTGNDVGICAAEVGEEALAELELYAGGMLNVFVDSGAFSEVGFPGGRPTIVAPISEAEWAERLAMYKRLGRALRSQLWPVAPDCVAHQAETLARLKRWAPEIRELAALGCNVIVPVQKGELSMVEFSYAAERILGRGPWVWGIPMKKDATTLAELEHFASSLHTGSPSRVHLLGLGRKSPRFVEAISAVRLVSPLTGISCDSVRITALVGRTNGPGGKPRALTAARDAVLREGKAKTVTDVKHAALSRVMQAETRTELQAARRLGWFDPELESAPGVPLEPGCIEYGPGGPFGKDEDHE